VTAVRDRVSGRAPRSAGRRGPSVVWCSPAVRTGRRNR
jgi:hypothetical protein